MEKKVSRLGLMTMSIGGMIGWGAFMQPGLKFLPEAGMLNTMISMLVGLVMVAVIATCYGIILNQSPESKGGEYDYCKLAFGQVHQFVVGWFLLIVFVGIAALNTTSFALIFKNVLYPATDFITLYTVAGSPVTLGEVLISLAVILVFSWFMLKGVKSVVRVQNTVTVLMIFIVFGMFALAFGKMDMNALPMAEHLQPSKVNLTGLVSILVVTPWAYYGVSNIPKLASDARLPYKQVIMITVTSLVFGFFIYQILLLMTANAFVPTDLLDYNGWATGEAIEKLFGKSGLLLITVGLAFAIFSGINSFYMGATRVMVSMSEDGLLPVQFKEKHKTFGTPYKSVSFILVIIALSPFFGRQVLSWIVGMSALGGALVFLYTALTAYRISRGLERGIGFAATVFSLIFILLLVIPGSPGFLETQSIIALLLWAGLGAYLYRTETKKYMLQKEI